MFVLFQENFRYFPRKYMPDMRGRSLLSRVDVTYATVNEIKQRE